MSFLTTSALEPTYSVSELGGELATVLGEVFGNVWVAGEVQRFRPSNAGHVYFELVEKGRGDTIVGKLDAVIWRTDYLRISRLLARAGVRPADGQQLRLRGNLDFYGPGGRIQLLVREIDPVFALGDLARRRQETLRALGAAGLLERNRELVLPALPLRVALVTSRGSAAAHDFLATLRESGFGFAVTLFHATVQGETAERELAAALTTAFRLAVRDGCFDCLVLVRGGGARTDLAVFDNLRLAELVAKAPLPVLTGLGHEIDQSVVDAVAHTSAKTPTAVGEILVGAMRTADAELVRLVSHLERAGSLPLRRARAALDHARQGVRAGALVLAAAGERIDSLAKRLARSGLTRAAASRNRLAERAERLVNAPARLLARRRREPELLAGRLVGSGQGFLTRRRQQLDHAAQVAGLLSPERVKARGFSITRTASGRLVRDATTVAVGEELVSELAVGRLRSTVTDWAAALSHSSDGSTDRNPA